jgi:hypothetical protein
MKKWVAWLPSSCGTMSPRDLLTRHHSMQSLELPECGTILCWALSCPRVALLHAWPPYQHGSPVFMWKLQVSRLEGPMDGYKTDSIYILMICPHNKLSNSCSNCQDRVECAYYCACMQLVVAHQASCYQLCQLIDNGSSLTWNSTQYIHPSTYFW